LAVCDTSGDVARSVETRNDDREISLRFTLLRLKLSRELHAIFGRTATFPMIDGNITMLRVSSMEELSENGSPSLSTI
jgi:hypothetical protein